MPSRTEAPATVAPDAVTAGVRPPERRRGMSRLERRVGLPLAVFVIALVAMIVVATGAYALAGTDAPFLVNARGPRKGPAPVPARVGAGVLCLLFLAVIGVFVRTVVLRALARPYVAVDDRGVWLTRGRYVQQGLRWDEIAAAAVVTEAAAPVTAVPYLDLYPAGRAADGDGPLDRRVVTAGPAAPGLRGRRYAIALTGPATEPARLDAALRRHGAPRPGEPAPRP
ncbi:hypothetical protein [Streptomyces sp. NPDC059788]|uniref:hypothetical protein n=1 Tax=Streptomyces sp. NPDC059788 TaxID=3346948 RepID=UPI003662BB16